MNIEHIDLIKNYQQSLENEALLREALAKQESITKRLKEQFKRLEEERDQRLDHNKEKIKELIDELYPKIEPILMKYSDFKKE